jgi:hypothetical protein
MTNTTLHHKNFLLHLQERTAAAVGRAGGISIIEQSHDVVSRLGAHRAVNIFLEIDHRRQCLF